MGTHSIYKFFLTLSLSAHYGQISVFFGRNFSLAFGILEAKKRPPHPDGDALRSLVRKKVSPSPEYRELFSEFVRVVEALEDEECENGGDSRS